MLDTIESLSFVDEHFLHSMQDLTFDMFTLVAKIF